MNLHLYGPFYADPRDEAEALKVFRQSRSASPAGDAMRRHICLAPEQKEETP